MRGIRKKNLCWIGYQVLARQGSVEIWRIYSAHQNTCFWVFLFPQIDWGSNVKMSSTPFFPQKSFAKKFSKIQGQINPLSNLNLACEALFLLTFLLIRTQFLGWVHWFTQLSAKMKWYTASQSPESKLSITFHLMILIIL